MRAIHEYKRKHQISKKKRSLIQKISYPKKKHSNQQKSFHYLLLSNNALKFVFRVTRHISILKQARDVIAKYEQYLQVENMAKVDSAYGFLELVEALRDTSQTEMKSLIRNYNNTDIM